MRSNPKIENARERAETARHRETQRESEKEKARKRKRERVKERGRDRQAYRPGEQTRQTYSAREQYSAREGKRAKKKCKRREKRRDKRERQAEHRCEKFGWYWIRPPQLSPSLGVVIEARSRSDRRKEATQDTHVYGHGGDTGARGAREHMSTRGTGAGGGGGGGGADAEVLTLLEADTLADLRDGRVWHPHHLVVGLAVATITRRELSLRPKAVIWCSNFKISVALHQPNKSKKYIGTATPFPREKPTPHFEHRARTVGGGWGTREANQAGRHDHNTNNTTTTRPNHRT